MWCSFLEDESVLFGFVKMVFAIVKYDSFYEIIVVETLMSGLGLIIPSFAR